MKSLKERLEEKLVPSASGCLEWIGYLNNGGYGVIKNCGKNVKVHRVAWELHSGITPTLDVLHHCDNRICCNTEHLYLGTDADNIRDKVDRGRQYYKVDKTMVIFMNQLRGEGLSMAQIGECLGVHRASVSYYLSGKRRANH